MKGMDKKVLRTPELEEQMKILAVQEEKRSELRKKYPKLDTKSIDKIIAVNEIPKPQNWKTFSVSESVDINGKPGKVVAIAPKDIVLDFTSAPPVAVKDVVEINKHHFRVRKVKGTMATIRPLLGTSRQYV